MILLWGVDDSPLGMIRTALESMGASYLFLNHAEARDTYIELEYSPGASGVITFHGRAYPVEDFHAIYVRPHDFSELPEFADLDCDSPQWKHARELQNILWSFADIADALVLNRPSAMLSNGSKPYQSRLIEEQGFNVPETLITTDADTARNFRAAHGEVIYKSISGTRSIVNRLADDHDARLNNLQWCPTQFQRQIAGVDYRVHVVGDQLFASRVLSDGVDYRYADSRIEACELPDVIAERCLALSRTLELPLAGVDLRRTPDGQWFCFEVNPSPGFSCYEAVTGQPISRAIAHVLVERDHAARHVG